MKVSVIAPVYNEVENLPRLYEALTPVLQNIGHDYEIMLIDDGSRDGSWEILNHLLHRISMSK